MIALIECQEGILRIVKHIAWLFRGSLAVAAKLSGPMFDQVNGQGATPLYGKIVMPYLTISGLT